mgnify:CR=1 FL=1
MPWRLIFFRQGRGEEPVREFLRALPKAARIEAGAALTDLERLGPALRRPDADFLANGIYELRFRAVRVEYRILYFFAKDRVVLAHGFIKKSAAVPKSELEKAVSRREIWRSA